jgi:Zn-dependent peptidase ImmA (M78 family)/transcriptional regulator with XRE-family HTH domain
VIEDRFVAYNPDILRDALKARSLTQGQLSKRLGIELPELERELRREPEPKQGLLNDIAEELSLPSFVFFMEKTPPLHQVIPDFRSPNPAPKAKTRETIQSIQFAEGVQGALAEGAEGGVSNLPRFTATTSDEVDTFALRARQHFGITLEEQAEAKDARTFYNICRKRVEDKGIIVLQDSFPHDDGSGFCLFHTKHPVIVVNTKKQTRARRNFTMIHELGHVLMHKSGISDPFVSLNETERLCNRFAGSFLAPKTYVSALLGSGVVKDPDLDDVRWAARRLKISQEATVLRLEQLGFYEAGTYDKWKKLTHNANPDWSEKKGGPPGPPAQEKVKLAKYGFRFAEAFDNLLREGRISEVNLYRATGLKPQYQRAYFDYARSVTAGELRTLELDEDE